MNSPFTLTFGKKPSNYILRLNNKDLVKESFNQENSSIQTYIISGLRGSGKTVFMTDISNDFEKEEDWIVVNLNPEKDLLEGLASELYLNTKIKSIFLKTEFSFSFHGVEIHLDGVEPAPSSETLVRMMLKKIKAKKKKVLITIDEVTSNNYMRIFANSFQSFIREDLPVFLLMTGLYENISKLQDEKSLTFLYRSPKIYLDSLNISSIADSYTEIFNIDRSKSLELAKLTNGYAYAYQVLGYLLMKHNKKDIDNEIIMEYDYYLQEYIYYKVWPKLTINEKNILSFFDSDKPIKIKDLILKSNKSSSYLSVYRNSLIKKGIVYSPSYGELQFSLPRFKNFIDSINM